MKTRFVSEGPGHGDERENCPVSFRLEQSTHNSAKNYELYDVVAPLARREYLTESVNINKTIKKSLI